MFKTNFIKTFLITLAIYLGLNAVVVVITAFVAPTFPLNDIYLIITSIFQQITYTPDIALLGFGTLHLTPDIFEMLLTLLSLLLIILPPLIAAIVGARLGDSGKVAFLAWFLTSIITSIVFLVLIFLAPGISPTIGGYWGTLVSSFGLFGAILYIIVPGIINGFFYGCISFLASKD